MSISTSPDEQSEPDLVEVMDAELPRYSEALERLAD